MPEQVPEGKSKEAQLEELLSMMMGHEIFRRHRGKLGDAIIERMKKLARSNMSWNQKRKAFDDLVADLRVLLNVLHKLFRDKKDAAFNELSVALEKKEYLLPGEKVADSETVPFVLFIIDPAKTLFLLKWYISKCREYCFDALKHRYEYLEYSYEDLKENSTIDEVTLAVAQMLPSLCLEFKSGLALTTLSTAASEELLIFKEAFFEAYKKDILYKQTWAKKLPDKMKAQPLKISSHDFCPAADRPVAFWAQGEQKDLLKNVPRDSQKMVSSWQFRIPKFYTLGQICLHEGNVHRRWKRIYPMQASKNVVQGYGAMACHSIHDLNDYYADKHSSMTRILLSL